MTRVLRVIATLIATHSCGRGVRCVHQTVVCANGPYSMLDPGKRPSTYSRRHVGSRDWS